MTFLHPLRRTGHVLAALEHYNRARDAASSGGSPLEVSDLLFSALNKLQTEWLVSFVFASEPLGETKAFKELFKANITGQLRTLFLTSAELRSFVELKPLIWNHATLVRGRWHPSEPMPSDLLKKAADEHHKLELTFAEYARSPSSDVESLVVARAAGLLYIVRSNIKHGEKTSSGPDLDKRSRDDAVCRAAVPLQLLVVDLLLGRPSTRLVAYGTLRPGGVNHRLLSDLGGTWRDCTIEGVLDEFAGLPALRWSPGSGSVAASLLESEGLPGYWPTLDTFEGCQYKRHLIAANTGQATVVANAFVAADQT